MAKPIHIPHSMSLLSNYPGQNKLTQKIFTVPYIKTSSEWVRPAGSKCYVLPEALSLCHFLLMEYAKIHLHWVLMVSIGSFLILVPRLFSGLSGIIPGYIG